MKPLIKSENFYVGYDTADDRPKGRIFLNGNHFANFYTVANDWGKYTNKICFNREGMAIDMNCPVIEPQDGLEIILNKLEIFLTEYKKIHLK
jgi:hypothetical protein